MIEIDKNPSEKNLRWFGVLLALFCGVLGALIRWKFTAPNVALGLWCAGPLLALVYYAVPVIRKPMYVGWMYAVFPIGWVVSHLLMAIGFYLVFTPIGLILKICGRDPLYRGFDPQASSYWVKRPPAADPARYFKQF